MPSIDPAVSRVVGVVVVIDRTASKSLRHVGTDATIGIVEAGESEYTGATSLTFHNTTDRVKYQLDCARSTPVQAGPKSGADVA